MKCKVATAPGTHSNPRGTLCVAEIFMAHSHSSHRHVEKQTLGLIASLGWGYLSRTRKSMRLCPACELLWVPVGNARVLGQRQRTLLLTAWQVSILVYLYTDQIYIRLHVYIHKHQYICPSESHGGRMLGLENKYRGYLVKFEI